MPEPIYVLVLFALYFLGVLSFAMLLRAVLSWFITDGGGKFIRFLYTLTEPMVYPFRKLFHKLNWFQETPLDVSFLAGMLFITIVQMILNVMLQYA